MNRGILVHKSGEELGYKGFLRSVTWGSTETQGYYGSHDGSRTRRMGPSLAGYKRQSRQENWALVISASRWCCFARPAVARIRHCMKTFKGPNRLTCKKLKMLLNVLIQHNAAHVVFCWNKPALHMGLETKLSFLQPKAQSQDAMSHELPLRITVVKMSLAHHSEWHMSVLLVLRVDCSMMTTQAPRPFSHRLIYLEEPQHLTPECVAFMMHFGYYRS